MTFVRKTGYQVRRVGMLSTFLLLAAAAVFAQESKPAGVKKAWSEERPKLVVMIVVDQFRADYVDKFQGQWSGGLKRLVEEGAWFRASAYPYATTETCVGHATIATGALPVSHGMVANSWWDRETKEMTTCTNDPNVKNIAYAGGTTKGGDSAWRMLVPSFAEELKFQTGGGTRIVAISIKARAAITMAGHKADAVTWLDSASGSWITSSAYGSMPFVEEFAKAHPIAEDYGKTWSLSLPRERYWYVDPAVGAETVEGWGAEFPHALRGKDGAADKAFYYQWATSPFANTYLTKMAENSVDTLGLGKAGGTDYLGVSYSSVDYVGHTFGPRSWELQDVLVRLDQDLGELFAQLDERVGRGNYVVALTGDHGVAPVLADVQHAGFDVGVVRVAMLEERIEKALEPFHLPSPAIARMSGNEMYFTGRIYETLRQNPAAMKAVINAASSLPGIAAVYTADELRDGAKSLLNLRNAAELSYFAGRSGDLYILQRPYWQLDSLKDPAFARTGANHGTPYYYDQRVPILMMGFGIKPGEYFEAATPADIAPTLATLTGVMLSTRDGRVLREALRRAGAE
jgi:predicted AlkP superfamily pyrophosphatase or phosphodiesterase